MSNKAYISPIIGEEFDPQNQVGSGARGEGQFSFASPSPPSSFGELLKHFYAKEVSTPS